MLRAGSASGLDLAIPIGYLALEESGVARWRARAQPQCAIAARKSNPAMARCRQRLRKMIQFGPSKGRSTLKERRR